MKLLIIAGLAVAVTAWPQDPKAKGSGGSGGSPRIVSTELIDGTCKPITFIWARASTEAGNMGGSVGPIVCEGLKKDYPDKVACQGVGQPYTAGLLDNVGALGTTQAAVGEATKMFTTAHSKCPATKIVFGGYSQGTAVIMNAVKGLSADVRKQVVAGVFYGYTKNAQLKGMIPGYPKEDLLVFCMETSPGKYEDGVCGGQLNVNAGHMAYRSRGDGPKGVTFLKGKLDAAGV
ncbi:cutinase [Tothia fuscella]|uniref:Cutinase n=1 Tax=Tothia fuscella TaxID=1048955 RepID=A0A9P4P0P1_9PEZI|nr:cutinase [Tothia fuscella]